MTRILATALLAAALAAGLLLLLERGQELWMWEILLVAIVVWLARAVPIWSGGPDRRLFAGRSTTPIRLPRSLSEMERGTAEALAGNPNREQRLRPVLERIAAHRLGRHGLSLESSEAMASLGEEPWRWLTGREGTLRRGELDQLVSQLERL